MAQVHLDRHRTRGGTASARGTERRPVNRSYEGQREILDQTLALRHQLLDVLTDDDLAFALPGNPALGELCRQAGQLQHIYIDSFRTLTSNWTPEPSPEEAERRVALPADRVATRKLLLLR